MIPYPCYIEITSTMIVLLLSSLVHVCDNVKPTHLLIDLWKSCPWPSIKFCKLAFLEVLSTLLVPFWNILKLNLRSNEEFGFVEDSDELQVRQRFFHYNNDEGSVRNKKGLFVAHLTNKKPWHEVPRIPQHLQSRSLLMELSCIKAFIKALILKSPAHDPTSSFANWIL